MNTTPVSAVDCSIERLPLKWTWKVITTPEGADHPVVLGRAGNCEACAEGLEIHASQIQLPTEIVPEEDEESRGEGGFCHCKQCTFIREMLNQ